MDSNAPNVSKISQELVRSVAIKSHFRAFPLRATVLQKQTVLQRKCSCWKLMLKISKIVVLDKKKHFHRATAAMKMGFFK